MPASLKDRLHSHVAGTIHCELKCPITLVKKDNTRLSDNQGDKGMIFLYDPWRSSGMSCFPVNHLYAIKREWVRAYRPRFSSQGSALATSGIWSRPWESLSGVTPLWNEFVGCTRKISTSLTGHQHEVYLLRRVHFSLHHLLQMAQRAQINADIIGVTLSLCVSVALSIYCSYL